MAADSPLSVPHPAPTKAPHPAPTKAPRPVSYAEYFVRDLPPFPSRAALRALTDRELPSEDAQPIPESMFQHPTIYYTVGALERWFATRRPGTCVAGELVVYSEGRAEADGRVRANAVVPDVLVAFAVGEHRRHSYVLWQEGKAPEFVLEVASVSTWRRDRDEKPAVYAGLGVREYFLYDPVGRWLEPRVQGYELVRGRYRRLRGQRLEDGSWGVRSRVLGLWAQAKGPEGELRWRDPDTGRELEYFNEVHDSRDAEAAARREEAAARRTAESRAQEAEARAEEEATARRAAEARAEEQATARREEATARREAEVRAEEQTAARAGAEAQVAALRARLRELEDGRPEDGP